MYANVNTNYLSNCVSYGESTQLFSSDSTDKTSQNWISHKGDECPCDVDPDNPCPCSGGDDDDDDDEPSVTCEQGWTEPTGITTSNTKYLSSTAPSNTNCGTNNSPCLTNPCCVE